MSSIDNLSARMDRIEEKLGLVSKFEDRPPKWWVEYKTSNGMWVKDNTVGGPHASLAIAASKLDSELARCRINYLQSDAFEYAANPRNYRIVCT